MKRLLFVLFSFAFVSSAYAEPSSFTKLLEAGKPVECDFHKKDGSQKGTIYVSQEMLRGDFQMKQGDTEYPMHMIRDTQHMYTWGGPMGEGNGVVMPASMASANGPMGNTSQANMNEEMDFTCKDWSVDAGKFETPSDVTFTDMGNLSSLMSGQMPSQENS